MADLNKLLRDDMAIKKANDQQYINLLNSSLLALDEAIVLSGNANRDYRDLSKAKGLIEARLADMAKPPSEILSLGKLNCTYYRSILGKTQTVYCNTKNNARYRVVRIGHKYAKTVCGKNLELSEIATFDQGR